jgi:hypothetical protein
MEDNLVRSREATRTFDYLPLRRSKGVHRYYGSQFALRVTDRLLAVLSIEVGAAFFRAVLKLLVT